jgi:hypothetical protein
MHARTHARTRLPARALSPLSLPGDGDNAYQFQATFLMLKMPHNQVKKDLSKLQIEKTAGT